VTPKRKQSAFLPALEKHGHADRAAVMHCEHTTDAELQ